MEGIHRERSERMAGRQAQIVATLISRKDQMDGITLSPIAESAYPQSVKQYGDSSGAWERLAGLIKATSKIHNILQTNHASYTSTKWGIH
jgi:hypothetical protein